MPRADWKRHMQPFKEAGGTCLATYIPWLLHEPVEGRFAFATGFASFAEVKPPAADGPATLPESRRRRDYHEFHLGTVAEYASTLAGWIRGHGIDVPLVHNSGGSHEGRSLVFLLNLPSSPMEASVRCRPATRGTWVDTGTHVLEAMSVKVVAL